MPLPLIPLALGGISALSGLFGNKKKQTSETTSNQSGTSTSATQGTSNTTGVSSGNFNQTATQGFAPGFESTANDILSNMFARLGPQVLNPEDLRTQELVEKNRVSSMADRLFGSVRGDQFSKGLAFSPSGEGLSRGLSEMFRGSGILDVAGKFAQRRFELPEQQEAINASQRNSLGSIFNMLPRSTTTQGSDTRNTSQNTVSNQNTNSSFQNQGTSTGTNTASQGNPVFNAIAGGLTGFGAAGGFNGGPLANIFGSTGNLTDQFRTPPFIPQGGASNDALGLPLVRF